MYKIVITHHFKKQLKRLVKKDLLLKGVLIEELENFEKDNAISVGKSIYKIRLSASGRGKSSGYRLYLLCVEIQGLLAPMAIYPKNEMENMSKPELVDHLEATLGELFSL